MDSVWQRRARLSVSACMTHNMIVWHHHSFFVSCPEKNYNQRLFSMWQTTEFQPSPAASVQKSADVEHTKVHLVRG